MSHHTRRLFLAILILVASGTARAQFMDSASGLLLAPSADMNPSGTFMITNNWMDPHTLPDFPWGYRTFQYGINITFWSRLEIGYVMTLIDGSKMENPPFAYWKVMKNQDRHFYGKFQLLREGEFGWKWIPSLAVGVSDPTTGGTAGDYISENVGAYGNGYFNRYYVMLTKHIDTPIGEFGIHAGYQYNKRLDYAIDGPAGGINWRPKWIQNDWVKLNIIGEYDARTWNTGLILSVYKDHFDLMFLLQDMKWISAGLRYKLVLYR